MSRISQYFKRLKLAFLPLILVVTVLIAASCAFAGEGSHAGSDSTQKYLVNDDGSETLLSNAQYRQLKESGSLSVPTDGTEDGFPIISEAVKPKATPTYNGVFDVYSTYFNYYPYNMAFENTGGMSIWGSNKKLVLEYSSDGVNWATTGYMSANFIELAVQQGYEISGLTPDTTYWTRIRYADESTYLNTTRIKTGKAAAPKVKSVTAKAVNVKYRKVRHYWYGVYMYTEKFYTCKVKVTVKLKKKPGTPGIYINDEWVGGNKKTYTKTFTPYPNYFFKNPRHRKKFTVSIKSAQSRDWGGYSPVWSKIKKLS